MFRNKSGVTVSGVAFKDFFNDRTLPEYQKKKTAELLPLQQLSTFLLLALHFTNF